MPNEYSTTSLLPFAPNGVQRCGGPVSRNRTASGLLVPSFMVACFMKANRIRSDYQSDFRLGPIDRVRLRLSISSQPRLRTRTHSYAQAVLGQQLDEDALRSASRNSRTTAWQRIDRNTLTNRHHTIGSTRFISPCLPATLNQEGICRRIACSPTQHRARPAHRNGKMGIGKANKKESQTVANKGQYGTRRSPKEQISGPLKALNIRSACLTKVATGIG